MLLKMPSRILPYYRNHFSDLVPIMPGRFKNFKCQVNFYIDESPSKVATMVTKYSCMARYEFEQ